MSNYKRECLKITKIGKSAAKGPRNRFKVQRIGYTGFKMPMKAHENTAISG
jgi:hypothetical protein